ncbi:MAG TPA: hypothetical protein VFW33_04850 [Gemmataceae bacterium]|nr:hypothetical protein [Gemmataceae bacterium]
METLEELFKPITPAEHARNEYELSYAVGWARCHGRHPQIGWVWKARRIDGHLVRIGFASTLEEARRAATGFLLGLSGGSDETLAEQIMYARCLARLRGADQLTHPLALDGELCEPAAAAGQGDHADEEE